MLCFNCNNNSLLYQIIVTSSPNYSSEFAAWQIFTAYVPCPPHLLKSVSSLGKTLKHHFMLLSSSLRFGDLMGVSVREEGFC